jgi:hypothetical protein
MGYRSHADDAVALVVLCSARSGAVVLRLTKVVRRSPPITGSR